MFKKITVIDNVILYPEYYRRLAGCAEKIELDLGLPNDELQRRLRVLESTGASVECITECRSDRLSDEQLIDRISGTDCLITCWQPMSEQVLEAVAGRLKLVMYWTDIMRADAETARRLGIVVDNVPEYGVRAVSEYVFAALLEVLRRPAFHHRRACSGSYDYENFKTARKGVLAEEEIYEETLHGKHLGVVGLGRIGRRVAAIARFGFDMTVSYFSRRRAHDESALGLRYQSLEEIFEKCDIISVHLPPYLQKAVIGAPLLGRIKPCAVFVNTGSAAAVDYEALYPLLEERRFRAVLDVFPGLPPRKRLQNLDNVFFTYRTAWFTRQSLATKAEILVRKLEGYAAALTQ